MALSWASSPTPHGRARGGRRWPVSLPVGGRPERRPAGLDGDGGREGGAV